MKQPLNKRWRQHFTLLTTMDWGNRVEREKSETGGDGNMPEDSVPAQEPEEWETTSGPVVQEMACDVNSQGKEKHPEASRSTEKRSK